MIIKYFKSNKLFDKQIIQWEALVAKLNNTGQVG